MKKSLISVAAALALVGSASAWAQSTEFVAASEAYQPLTGATQLAVSTGSQDESFWVVQLPFSFPYFGQTYDRVFVAVNGFIAFSSPCVADGGIPAAGATGTCSNFSLSGAELIPSPSLPNNLIAPWYDDLKEDSAGALRYTSSPSAFDIEWSNWGSFTFGTTPPYRLNMKIHLESSGLIKVSYGTISGTGASAIAGFENATGTVGASILAKANSTCTATSQAGCCSTVAASGGGGGCSISNWVPNSVITFGDFVEADLTPEDVASTGPVVTTTGVEFDVSANIRNLGRTDAGDFNWVAYLSPTRTLTDAGMLIVADGGFVSVGSRQSVSVTSHATTPMLLDAGQYWVFVRVDPDNFVTEATKLNNVRIGDVPVTIGSDLQAYSVSGPAGSVGGYQEMIHTSWGSRGTQDAGTVSMRILLSSDNALDMMDFPVGTVTRSLSAQQQLDEDVQLTIPTTIAQGDYFYILQVDPMNAIAEANEGNNWVSSINKVTIRKPDLVNTSVDLVDPVTNAQIRTARLGDRARVLARITNASDTAVAPFRVGVVLSTDSTLSLLSDLVLAEPVADGGLGPRSGDAGVGDYAVDFTFPFSARADGGGAYQTGPYYVFVVADSRNTVGESDESNNNKVIGPIRLVAPGPDLVVTTLQPPSSAGVGETIPVFRSFRNTGNQDAPQAIYRYYASANDIITPDDVPLDIVRGSMTVATGTITLAAGAGDTATELVKLPSTMPAGRYYVGCLLDGDNMVSEIDETNNGRASSAISVVASALQVNAVQLPDATLGKPYSFQLSASGELGASMWTLATNQGALPAGLTLAANGTISGTPMGTAASVAAFTVNLTNNARTTTARLVMRVLPSTTQLEVTTTNVPAVTNSSMTQYLFKLGAAGGVAPYSWRLATGTLPTGLALSADGTLSGAPRAGVPDGITRVTVEVRDAANSIASRELALRLVAPGGLAIRTLSLPVGIVGGDPYAVDVALVSPVQGDTYTWTVSGLPPGLMTETLSSIVSISGKPTRPGNYPVSITVEDNKGRRDSVDYVLRVYAAAYRVVTTQPLPSLLRPGVETSMSFAVQPTANVKFSVVSGALPPGLTFTEAGVLAGTVDSAATDMTYNFVVQAVDEAGASGLGPFALRVERPAAKVGCSTGAGMAPLALGLLALRRRRRPQSKATASKGLLAAALLALMPALAMAQVDYQVDGPRPISGTYVGLVQGVATTVTSGTSVSLPFSFNFYGQPLTSVAMSTEGYLAVGGATVSGSTNQPLPHSVSSTTAPTALIAPWWDDLTAGTLLYQVKSTPSGDRFAVFEWKDFRGGSSTTTFSFQAQLFEKTGQIRFVYGAAQPGSASASIGAQRALGAGVGATTCGQAGSCGPSNFPSNSVIDLFLPPDLKPGALSVEQVGFAGVGMRVGANVRNEGGRDVTNAAVRFYLSTDSTLDRQADVQLQPDCVAPLVPAQQEASTAVCTPVIPAATAVGNYFLIAEVDPGNQIAEQVETNNVSTAVAMAVGMPTPDLSVIGVSAPAMATPGAMVAVNRTLTNLGNADSTMFSYSYFLSENSVVTISDRFLGPVRMSAPLTPTMPNVGSDMVALPSDIPPGNYWLGVCVNFDGAASTIAFPATEITVGNNCSGSMTRTLISTSTVAVTTSTLPAAAQYAPYGLRLQASGGNGSYVWSINSGMLPPGLSLSAAGDLAGAPATTGSFTFEAKVVSGTLNATKSLSLMVTAANLPLVIVDQTLSAAEFGRAYSASLVAVGGKPPYTWALKDTSTLPNGLALAGDGSIEGRAVQAGETTFTVTVKDTANATAEKTLKVQVVPPSTLAIGTVSLQPGKVRSEYLQPLVAVGGKAPYVWSVTGFQRLPENATEAPGVVAASLPTGDEGLGVQVMGSFLSGTPKRGGEFALTLTVRDAAGAEDSVTLVLKITYADPLAITTTVLPDAFLGQPYSIKLSHNAARDAKVKFLAACSAADQTEDQCVCVRQATAAGTFQCVVPGAFEQLPSGLALAADGSVTVTFDDKRLAGAAVGTYAFLVKAVDDAGRQDVRSLSIRVRDDFEVKTTGCSGGGFELATVSLVSMLGLALRRRRSTTRFSRN